ncbi:MAG: tRNA lysidine(34) synthetase TilS [Candidatus Omnitrophota bacterium]|nr:tRNA lysidine(34) synthetase TilS [Candidatus Omnitrophota bacterium]
MIDLLGTARSSIARHRMFRPGDRVLVAVSGGPDSLAMLSVLTALRKELKLTLRAAYVDHGLRPAAAKKEAALVKRLGKEWGVPVTVLRRPVRKGKKDSLESSARETRYEGLAALAGRIRAQAIATGHTADDQAETVLMRILRGSGITGLAGIPPVRALGKLRIVRPLIGCTREQVMEHLRAGGLHPLLDRSNLSPRFVRNRIRNDLLIRLENEFNPQVRKHLCQLAELMREDQDWMAREAGRRFRQVARLRAGKVRLNRTLLRKEPPGLRRAVLRLAAQRLQGSVQGFSLKHWEMLDGLLAGRGTGAADLPHRFRAEAREGTLVLSRLC